MTAPKKGLLVTAIWLKMTDEDRTRPEIWIELSDGWHQVFASKDITCHDSLICELYPRAEHRTEAH